MSRVLAVLTAWLVLCGGSAVADTVETSVAQLGGDGSSRVRLTAALSLSKSKDPRAVNALAGALGTDTDPAIRRVSALALEKMIDARTAPDAIEIALRALEEASTSDADLKVREFAARAYRSLQPLRRKRSAPPPAALPRTGDKPEVFVNIDPTLDQSKLLPPGGGERLMKIVKQSVERTGFSTTWPGGLPTAAELTSNRSRAFIVASTVKKIEITKVGSQTQVSCTVGIRIAPWSGRDGGERWEANRAASASGSAKAMTGNRDRDVQGGVRDCLEAVAEDVTSRQVVPFLKRLATTGS
ncbi:MAG: HEAT repeat domain-containing protein [Kofleriaceae bacterium]